jgi:hypothetical protein
VTDQQAPPGWYPTPDGQLGYWNGQRWTQYPAITTKAKPAARRRRLTASFWVPIGVGTALVLAVGSCMAYALSQPVFQDVGAACDSFTADEVGPGEYGDYYHPMQVEEGDGFTIDGFSYQEGWRVVPRTSTDTTVTFAGLLATSHRDGKDRARLWVRLCRDNVVMAEAECNSGYAKVQPGASADMWCVSAHAIPASYDKITVARG